MFSRLTRTLAGGSAESACQRCLLGAFPSGLFHLVELVTTDVSKRRDELIPGYGEAVV